MSSPLSDWHKSNCGKILPIIDFDTLSKVRNFWHQYAVFADTAKSEREKARDRFLKDFCQQIDIFALGGLRSIGAPFFEAMKVVPEAFQRYWKTGVVGGLPALVGRGQELNPLFVYSNVGGDKCAVHYGTDPILGFHCGTAFSRTIGEGGTRHRSLKQFNKDASTDEMIELLSKTAMLEFKSWCSAFQSSARRALREPEILKIYSFCGDALEFSLLLRSRLDEREQRSNIYETCAAPWKGQIDFPANNDAAGPYDAIDTSNLADHLGLLNVLISALPLLKPNASSVLHTENLVRDIRGTGFDRFKFLLCGDPSLVFCLLRAAPTEYLTGVTAHCPMLEDICFKAMGDCKQFRLRLSWKDMALCDESLQASKLCQTPVLPSWDIDSLARSVVSIYYSMFEEEGFSIVSALEKRTTYVPRSYTRASFVGLLKLIHRRHHVESWSKFFDRLIELVSMDDPLSLRMLGAQELFLQLHLQRLHTSDNLCKAKKICEINPSASWPTQFTLSELTPAIPFLFRIPDAKLQNVLGKTNSNRINTNLLLDVVVFNPPFLNKYSVLQIAFVDQISNWDQLPSSWRNDTKDLIIFVSLPSWTLLSTSRETIEISLRLQMNVASVPSFAGTLGSELIIFKTSLFNSDFVVPVFRQLFLPVTSADVSNIAPTFLHPDPEISVLTPKISNNNGSIEVTARVEFTSDKKGKLGSNQKVTSTQKSACTLSVTLGVTKFDIPFPFPVKHSTVRLRIARKSGWIEVLAPFGQRSSLNSSFDFCFLPIMHRMDSGSYSWNLPRLLPSILPKLDLSASNLNWIDPNVASSMSARERTLREAHIGEITSGDDLVELKESIHAFFCRSAGVARLPNSTSTPGPARLFTLNTPSEGGKCIIFVTGVRLEPNDCTIVVDAYVLPLTEDILFRISSALSSILSHMLQLKCTEGSYELWTSYIKASVERGRYWNHLPSCPHKFQNGDADCLQQFLCRCGAGKVTKEFQSVKAWKRFTPFVTRCLFTPPFAVPWMESTWPEDPIAKLEEGYMNTMVATEKSDANGKWCYSCHAEGGVGGVKLFVCGGCKTAVYCSRECQKKHWKEHKAKCRR